MRIGSSSSRSGISATHLGLVLALTLALFSEAEAQRAGGFATDPNLADMQGCTDYQSRGCRSSVTGFRPAPTTLGNDIAIIYEDAIDYIEKGRYREAETKLEILLQRQQSVALPNYLMGQAKIGVENYPEALKYMKIAVKLDPALYMARGYVGALELQANNIDAVKEHLLFLDKAKKDCAATCEKKQDIDNAIALIMAQRQKPKAAG